MNPRWSASRLACMKQCLVSYKNTYINDFVMTGGKVADVLDKGTCAHEVCEWYDSSKTEEELRKYMIEHMAKFDFDKEKYDLSLMIPRFLAFWRTQVASREAQGFKVVKEGWKNFQIGSVKNWVGALDLVVEKDGEVFVFDYKTGGTAKISPEYQRQLMIYALAKGQEYGYDFDQIVDKVHVALFFPIAGLKDEEQTDPAIAEKNALKSLKSLVLKKEDLEALVLEVEKASAETDITSWNDVDGMTGNMGFWCSWCPYVGSVASQSAHKDFTPCQLSYDSGCRSLRGVKFQKKHEVSKKR